MKKIILTMLIASFSLSSFADCTQAYRDAAHKRTKRNLIIAGSATVALGAGAVIVSTGAVAGLLVLGYSVGLGVTPSLQDAPNTFSKLNNDFSSLKVNRVEKHLDKLIISALENAGVDSSEENMLKAQGLLLDGFKSFTFCPMVKMKKDGAEKRAVFNSSALKKYIRENI